MDVTEPGLTLFSHPLASYCWKVLLALYETDTAFHHERIDGPPKAHGKLPAMWPIGKMPVLLDRAREQIVPETSIIIEYLHQHYRQSVTLLPEPPSQQLDVRLWDRFFDLYVQTPMQNVVSDRMRPDAHKDMLGVREAKETLDTAYAMLDRRAQSQDWAAGDKFTMADCSAMPALFYAQAVHPFTATYPALAAYFTRLMDRPSSYRVIREAAPYFHYFPFREAIDPRFLRLAG